MSKSDKIIHIVNSLVGVIGTIVGILALPAINIIPVLGLTGWVFTFIAIVILLYKKITKPKNINLFLPRLSDSKDSFWSDFATQAHDKLTERGYHVKYKWLLKTDYDVAEQRKQLKETSWNNVDGAVISAAGEDVIADVIKLMDKHRKTKFILHDIAPGPAMEYFAKAPIEASIVSIDNQQGGILAAEIMYEYLYSKKLKTRDYEILILPGNSAHAHSNLRVQGFQNALNDKAQNNIAWYIAKDGEWTNEKAELAFNQYLENCSIIRNKLVNIDGMFVCNDEMALAAIDVIKKKNFLKLQDAVIVGFDNTYQLKRECKNNEQVIGTVDADIKGQAEAVADLMDDLIKGKIPKGTETIKIVKPKKIPRSKLLD